MGGRSSAGWLLRLRVMAKGPGIYLNKAQMAALIDFAAGHDEEVRLNGPPKGSLFDDTYVEAELLDRNREIVESAIWTYAGVPPNPSGEWPGRD